MKLHTKSDFTALMHRFLDPLLPLYSEGGARLHLGDTGVTYPGRTIEMEAFSRPLWALAPFWTGGGRADDFLRIYRKGLASGTDPESPDTGATRTIMTSSLWRWPRWPARSWRRLRVSGSR